MKIVGGKDYYDYALMYGRDTEVILARSNIVIPVQSADGWVRGRVPKTEYQKFLNDSDLDYVDWTPRTSFQKYRDHTNFGDWRRQTGLSWTDGRRTTKVEVGSVVVIVGDKLYRGVYFYTSTDSVPATHDFKYIWNPEDQIKFMSQFKLKDDMTHIPDDKEMADLRSYYEPRTITTTTRDWMRANRYSIITRGLPRKGDKEFREFSPASNAVYRINGDNLQQYEFYKKLDANQAMQEISMWVSSLPQNPAPNPHDITDDKVKIAKHGYDRWSFRKMGAKSR